MLSFWFLFALITTILPFLWWVFRTFVSRGVNVKKYLGKDKWVVITGASEGIGKGFAEEFAKLGGNLVLISLDEPALKSVASNCEELAEKCGHSIQTKIICAVFGQPGVYERVESELSQLDVTVLVNNVGVNTRYPEYFLDHSMDQIESMVHINIITAMRMTKMLLPGMLKSANGLGGLVFNMSSFTGVYPTPMMSVYSATKAYMRNFTCSLSKEYQKEGVIFSSYAPFYVVSIMSGYRKPSLMVCTGNRLAKDAFARVGTLVSQSPYVTHEVVMRVLGWIPSDFLLGYQLKQMITVRKRLVRRDERRAKKQ